MQSSSKTIQTYSKIYKDYADRNILKPEIIILLDKFIKRLKGKRVLDVGCAHGRDSIYMSNNGLDVYGIDLTPEFITLAKFSCPSGKFSIMDMRNLRFPEHIFDGIWASASFLHISKKEGLKTLKGFKKVLKPGAVLFISVMTGDSEGYRKNEKLNWDDRYFSFYQKTELENLLDKAGFKSIELVETQTSWGPVFLNWFFKSKV